MQSIKRGFKFILLLLFFFPLVAMAKNQVVNYEPKEVKLTGVIKNLQFPGPPNYESIEKGDADETGPYLVLDNPIDVMPESKSKKYEEDTPEKNVKLIQLVVENKQDWKKVREGNQVEVSGTLFHSHTGHHHARVLLTLKKISVISRQKTVSKDKDLDITSEDKEFINRK